MLGDRIGIMARGKLVALGTSLRLKATFGAGFRVTAMAASKSKEGGIKAFVETQTQGKAELVNNIEGRMTFQFAKGSTKEDESMMADFFGKMESEGGQVGTHASRLLASQLIL